MTIDALSCVENGILFSYASSMYRLDLDTVRWIVAGDDLSWLCNDWVAAIQRAIECVRWSVRFGTTRASPPSLGRGGERCRQPWPSFTGSSLVQGALPASSRPFSTNTYLLTCWHDHFPCPLAKEYRFNRSRGRNMQEWIRLGQRF